MAKKGQPVLPAGAAGTLSDIQNGEIIIQASHTQITYRLAHLGARQAVAHVDLKKEERLCNLMKGVFLAAEGAHLTAAERAHEAAGGAPHLAKYKERLDRCTREARQIA